MTTRALAAWVGVAGALTLLALGGYVVAQQTIRRAADHPQVEMARAAVTRLDSGASPDSVLPTTGVDIASSQDAYLIVVGTEGKVLASSATLGGVPPVPPAGVFDYVRTHGEDAISWEPAPGVRSAIVIDSFKGGFVVAGRSLKDTEELENNLILWVGAAWAAGMLALGGLAAVLRRR
jgi:hypothetical protein